MGHVQVERDGGIATVVISNPGRKNAIPPSAWPLLEAAFRELGTDPDVRCVVLTGEGDDFGSGAEMGGGDRSGVPPVGLPFMRIVGAAVEALHAVPQPVVARWPGCAWVPRSTWR
jgi:enoyl-CoA hydratase/carnithine racemase